MSSIALPDGLSGKESVRILALRFLRWGRTAAHWARLAGFVRDLGREGIALRYLDCGGGLGIRYTSEHPPEMAAYAAELARAVRLLGCHLLLEPGRSLIGPAGVILMRVLYTKKTRGQNFRCCGRRDERLSCGPCSTAPRIRSRVRGVVPVRLNAPILSGQCANLAIASSRTGRLGKVAFRVICWFCGVPEPTVLSRRRITIRALAPPKLLLMEVNSAWYAAGSLVRI